jgi:hypothetical protein
VEGGGGATKRRETRKQTETSIDTQRDTREQGWDTRDGRERDSALGIGEGGAQHHFVRCNCVSAPQATGKSPETLVSIVAPPPARTTASERTINVFALPPSESDMS